MKRQLILAALVIGILFSCKKSNSSGSGPAISGASSTYHLTCVIDGKATTFNAKVLGTRIIDANVTQVSVLGYTGESGSNIQSLGLTWTNTSADATFGMGTWTDTSTKYSVAGVYDITSTDAFESGTNATGQAFRDGKQITNHLKITYTLVDSSTLKGTFSGDFYDMGLIPGVKKTITDGDFWVQWKK